MHRQEINDLIDDMVSDLDIHVSLKMYDCFSEDEISDDESRCIVRIVADTLQEELTRHFNKLEKFRENQG